MSYIQVPLASLVMQKTTDIALVLFAFAFVIFMFIHACQAQYVEPEVTDDDVLMVARVFVSESGLRSKPDQLAILAVLRDVRRRFGLSTLAQAARKYSPRATGVRPQKATHRRYVAQLTLDGQKPKDWHRQKKPADWNRFRSGWLRLLERTRHLVRRTAGLSRRWTGGCEEPPKHWGATDIKADLRNWKAGKLVRIVCPGTLNAFYKRAKRRPSRLRGLRLTPVGSFSASAKTYRGPGVP